MNLAVSSSADGANWGRAFIVTNGYSDYGLQLVVYRGEMWGLMVQNAGYKNMMFLTKYNLMSATWDYFTTVSETARSIGRASVATLDDFFYCCWRGQDDGVYLSWTAKIAQGGQWNEVRVGSQYAKTKAAPAIAAFDGKLYIVGVGDDANVWFTVVDTDGTKLTTWTKINNTATQSALALTVYSGQLYLFFTAYYNNMFLYSVLDPSLSGSSTPPISSDTGGSRDKMSLPISTSWSQATSVSCPGMISGPAATTWNGSRSQLMVAYKGYYNNVKYRLFDRSIGVWSGEYTVPGLQMLYQVGVTTWGGKLFVSMGLAPGTFSVPSAVTTDDGIRSSEAMNEKSGLVVEETEDEEWECKWNAEEENKGALRKWFCM